VGHTIKHLVCGQFKFVSGAFSLLSTICLSWELGLVLSTCIIFVNHS